MAALLSLAMLGFEDKTDRDTEADLKEAETHLKAGQWCEVRIALARAEGRLARGGPKALRQKLEQMRKDVELILRLDAVRLGAADHKDADARYAAAFREWGIDTSKMKTEEIGKKVRESAIRQQLLEALDSWAMVKPVGADRKTLLAVADAADDSPWRKRLRGAIQKKDVKALTTLVTEGDFRDQPPAVYCLLAEALRQNNARGEAIKVLGEGQALHPADFWLNRDLAALLAQEPKGSSDAAGFYRAALALRPANAGVHLGLGRALMEQDKIPDALRAFRQAIALDPANPAAHLAMGNLLLRQGKMAEAEACFRKCLTLDPRFVSAYTSLGNAMTAVGKMNEAIVCYRKALELDPKNVPAHLNMGTLLHRMGKIDEAIARYRAAIALRPDHAGAYLHLGHALRDKGQLAEAIACFKKALELQPDFAAAKKALEAAMKAEAGR